jgi:hypothetical protein
MVQRDTVIRLFEHAVEGTNPAIRHQKRHRDLASLTDEQRAIVRSEVIEGSTERSAISSRSSSNTMSTGST